MALFLADAPASRPDRHRRGPGARAPRAGDGGGLGDDRRRARRKITVLTVTLARSLILLLALIPLIESKPLQLAALVAAQLAIALAGAVAGCAFNSWVHQLVPPGELGALFARRLFWSTVLASLGALSAGYLVQHWPLQDKLPAYSIAFVAAGTAGFVSSRYLVAVPEPVMAQTGPPLPLTQLIGAPLRDGNFRSVIVFMASWN